MHFQFRNVSAHFVERGLKAFPHRRPLETVQSIRGQSFPSKRPMKNMNSEMSKFSTTEVCRLSLAQKCVQEYFDYVTPFLGKHVECSLRKKKIPIALQRVEIPQGEWKKEGRRRSGGKFRQFGNSTSSPLELRWVLSSNNIFASLHHFALGLWAVNRLCAKKHSRVNAISAV